MTPPKGSMCFCGTKVDAYEVASNLVEELVNNNCPTWAFQVLAAMMIQYPIILGATLLAKPDSKLVVGAIQVIHDEMVEASLKGEFPKRLSKLIFDLAAVSVDSGHKDNGLLKHLSEEAHKHDTKQ